MMPITREAIVDRRQPLLRWGPILGGTALSIGLWIMLQVLGMGLGLTAVDTDDAGSLRGVGIGTGIWSVIAPLIALFVGGLLVGYLSSTRDRKVGAMHASVMWALALAIGTYLMISMISSLVGGVARVGAATAQGASSVVEKAAGSSGDLMGALGIDTNAMLGPINERLQRDGKPTITAQQLDATMKAVAQRGIRNGKLDRQVVVEELARNTALSRADAEEVATDIERQYGDLSSRAGSAVQEFGQDAKQVALEAADKTGKVLALGGLMMLLSLASAIAGGALGAHLLRRRDDVPPTSGVGTSTPVVTPGTAVDPVITSDRGGNYPVGS